MRIYAVLLGVLLTAGSAYVAQIAVASAGFERLARGSPGGGDMGAAGELWYGGVLHPITVDATRATPLAVAFGTPWTASSELAVSQKAVECERLARPKRHAITSDNVHASMGSMM
jgi:hypothetical protein